jgi:hypothetical protein
MTSCETFASMRLRYGDASANSSAMQLPPMHNRAIKAIPVIHRQAHRAKAKVVQR